ncbi:MAG: hypothetical protein M1823_002864 [Watsoniomyces obsoletus]|nr:MAG: hypothetical protein M1823_002864 [Watsoniomyces obsoletus]
MSVAAAQAVPSFGATLEPNPLHSSPSAGRAHRATHQSPSRDAHHDMMTYNPPPPSSGRPSTGRSTRTDEAPMTTSNATGPPFPPPPRTSSHQTNARPSAAASAAAATENHSTRTAGSGLGLVGSEGVDDGGRHGGRTELRFGDYVLGRTLGEGEFGKVKMGWKQADGVQVAIKLIRKEALGTNPTRLPKINREIHILKELSHPNIVRLHEVHDTDRYIGIILEYASGGELFDYILNHRYLKDPSARRLFAQLVSGVGYLHKKGVVHRDLKLENLLLDRHKNIIITDFGFANTFDPKDELGDEVEYHLEDKNFIKRLDLVRVRRGDLFSTSCGSPAYAAPELVTRDGLYTGRKVDVWSCGVILYAMLAGYLPYDDDPSNPSGDNINLLYKYITTTPLTFPDYVTPHARDLLRRILVPDPRKRADLFEVARHSWLSEYAHVVSFITSSTTTTGEISNTTVTADIHQEVPLLARSASVREPVKPHPPHSGMVDGLSPKHGQVDLEAQASPSRLPGDTNRRTLQVEYVPPSSEGARGESSAPADEALPSSREAPAQASPPVSSRPRTRPATGDDKKATSAIPVRARGSSQQADPTKASYQSPQAPRSRGQAAPTTSVTTSIGPPARPVRDPPRSVSDSTGGLLTGASIARPHTGGSLASTGSRSNSARLPSRGSYSRPGQPSMPVVASTHAEGRLAQPPNRKSYVISNPIPRPDGDLAGFGDDPDRPARTPRTGTGPPPAPAPATRAERSHKRSNTVGGIGEKIFGRSGSLFGGRAPAAPSRPSKQYPPTSMPSSGSKTGTPRVSSDSRRSSHGFGRTDGEKPKRFSFLPASFSFKHLSGSGGGGGSSTRDVQPPRTSHSMTEPANFQTAATRPPRPVRPVMAFGRGASQSTDGGMTEYGGPEAPLTYGITPQSRLRPSTTVAITSGQAQQKQQQPPQQQQQRGRSRDDSEPPMARGGGSSYEKQPQRQEERSEASPSPARSEEHHHGAPPPKAYPPGFDAQEEEVHGSGQAWPQERTGVHKPARKFVDAPAQGKTSSGSSGPARRVMDLFRRRGKARTWDER